MDFAKLLTVMVNFGASDLHLSAGMKPMFRLDGKMRLLSDIPPFEHNQLLAFANSLMNETQSKKCAALQEVDFSFSNPESGRFRVHVFHQQRGIALAFRVIPKEIPTLNQIKAPEILTQLSRMARGLVLLTGPSGSGKSTTLAAMIELRNRVDSAHILTLEDPIEFVHKEQDGLITQREIGQNSLSFAAALRSALRADPDVIMIGEMRDLETIRLALTAAETGHLVLATLHTTSASSTINRIIDVFPAAEKEMIRSMLSTSLQAIVSQQLLPKSNGGRVAAYEILMATPAIRNLIRENKLAQVYSAMQTGRQVGMQTLEQSLQELVTAGMISRKVAHDQANIKDSFV
ncbi:type IV pilus twitching motility protein PilT [Candidatus Magnetaquicoccus inordinatus]|uniref:type IV pilus twitching motility protein PilT n=1 Tax=Candidatus Magnetaquicoccus inordinatus TaxID=2496818 RepID=UPI00102CE2DD|nr:type IV pilus twitching motility protein PilT [Candidatus Magnetaquicoccus inordinatus]